MCPGGVGHRSQPDSVYSGYPPHSCGSRCSGASTMEECMSCSSVSSESSVWEPAKPFHGSGSPSPSSRRHYSGETSLIDDLAYQQQVEYGRCSSYLSTTQAAAGITAAQRASAVDNIILSAARLSLSNDALFTAVACFDRYLAEKPTPLNLLQPVGIACLWVSAKFEQLALPSAAKFSQLILGSTGVPLGNAPAAKELLVLLEESVLKALDYRIASFITAKQFKHQIMQNLSSSAQGARLSAQQMDRLYCVMSYLTETALLEYQLLQWLPSQIAAAAYGYAHVLLGLQLDVNHMHQLTRHSATEVQRIMEYLCALHATLCAALQLGKPYAVTVKYLDPSVGSVAAIAPMTSAADARVKYC